MLLQEAEDAKRALSTRTSVTIRFNYQGKRVQVALTREEFEALTSDLLQRTVFTVERLLRAARLQFSDLTRIMLVGGSTRMPMVQQALEQISGQERRSFVVPRRSRGARGGAVRRASCSKAVRLPIAVWWSRTSTRTIWACWASRRRPA